LEEEYNNSFKRFRLPEIMITFNDIYEAMRKEKYSDQLQLLPKKFLMECSEYFREKKEFLNKEDDLFSDMAIKNKKKLENAISSFRDLLRLRKKKILNLAFVAAEVGISKKDFENLLSFEKDLFEEVVKSLERAEKNMSSDMQGAQKDERKNRLVRFLEDVSEFLDFDGKGIGPFEKGEIANLGNEIVEILEKDKRIEVLEED
jgi:DNA replication initiation complex subunit (GINS family)